MSTTRSGYKKLGLEHVEPLQDRPYQHWRPPMAEEKKDEGERDLIKLLLKDTLEWQINEMMENFSQILHWMPTGNASSSNGHFEGITPFKVQVNFDIAIFEGQIDVEVLYKWLDILEGYFLVHSFFDREKITFALLKVAPHVKD